MTHRIDKDRLDAEENEEDDDHESCNEGKDLAPNQEREPTLNGTRATGPMFARVKTRNAVHDAYLRACVLVDLQILLTEDVIVVGAVFATSGFGSNRTLRLTRG